MKFGKKEKPERPAGQPLTKPAVSVEGFVFIALFLAFFISIGRVMGAINMLNTMMNTAFDLLINTVFYIMAIAVLAGAISALFSEFGVVSLLNKVLAVIMKPVWGLPGAASLGIVTTYLSDNPAILTLASDNEFKKYFKKYQLPALTNLGTAFGMGLIITAYMMGIKSPNGESFVGPALIGNLGAVIGSLVSTRLMLHFTSKIYGKDEWVIPHNSNEQEKESDTRRISEGGIGERFLNAMLTGGKSGVEVGFAIIPGVLIICTIVMILTNGAGDGGVYTGAAYEGIGLLPAIGEKLNFILKPLFGFTSSSCIAVPITALGAAGAAIGLIPNMIQTGIANAHDIAVFTAMSMCWSGYLSTHVAMMDGLNCRELTGKAIISHTVGGLCAGIATNWIFNLISMI
ncbi:MAG: hypothetical protein ACI4CC_02445 [Lachnospiraceae bacterium]